MESYNLTEAKAKLSAIISRVAFARENITIRKKGLAKSEPDLRIASIAIQHNMVLVAGNKKHFRDIPGLNVEDWINGE